jgi:hypothetical protein
MEIFNNLGSSNVMTIYYATIVINMPDDYETITIQKYYKDNEEEEDPETKSQQYLNPKPILRPPNMSQINPKYSSTFFFSPFLCGIRLMLLTN